jgi:hypothetical protein
MALGQHGEGGGLAGGRPSRQFAVGVFARQVAPVI